MNSLSRQNPRANCAGPAHGKLRAAFAPRLALALLALASASPLVRAADETDAALPSVFMPSSEVRPGMHGTGRTVVHGFKVEEFDVEILGVQNNAIAGSNMIVALLKAPYLENHGVVAGMSGSPVYINGRIIGAVAYGWVGSYKPYAGITPIEDMWSIWRNIGKGGEEAVGGMDGAENEDFALRAGAGARGGWDWRAAGEAYEKRYKSAQPAAGESLRFDAMPELRDLPGGMRPLAAPFMISGASPRTLAHLNAGLRMAGLADAMEPMAAGAGDWVQDHDGAPAPQLENGSSLAVPLMRGDLNLAATGTVTYCDGERLIAFGHPMFFEGPVRVPMAQSYIYGFMQSYGRSFKLSGVRETIGVLDQDRRFGVGGEFGEGPKAVPMTVSVSGEAASRPRDYHYQIWDSRTMLPSLATSALSESFEASVAESGRQTLRVSYGIVLADGRRIERRSLLTSDQGGATAAMFGMLRDLAVLEENPFRRAKIAGIDASFAARRGIRHEEIVSCKTDFESYEPGEKVRVTARIETYQRGIAEREFTIELPGDLREGQYVAHLVDASSAAMVEMRNAPSRFIAHDFNEMIASMQQGDYPEDQLSIFLFAPDVNVEMWNHPLAGAPSSIAGVVGATGDEENLSVSVGRLVSKQVIDWGQPIAGNETLAIDVARRKGP